MADSTLDEAATASPERPRSGVKNVRQKKNPEQSDPVEIDVPAEKKRAKDEAAAVSPEPPPRSSIKNFERNKSTEKSVSTERKVPDKRKMPHEKQRAKANAMSGIGFAPKEVRRAFIRKVYIILCIQLAITTGFIAIFIFVEPIGPYVREHYWITILALILFIIIYFTLACFSGLRRKYPLNVFMLALLTLVMSTLVGCVSCQFKTISVFLAFGICAGCCLAVTIFAFNTRFDFTSCIGVLFVASIALLIFGIIMIFVNVPVLHKVYSGLGALLFMLYLAVDTQMLMGGKRHQFSAEDYVGAAMQLYVDITQIFLMFLGLFGEAR